MPIPVIPYQIQELDLLSNLITGEAGGEGKEGMQNAGNVMINRVIAGRDRSASETCPDFKGIDSITKMVYQDPGGFEAVDKPQFYGPPNPDAHEISQQMVDGYTILPGKFALWFMNPHTEEECPPFFDTIPAGRFKNHCFYNPVEGTCPTVLFR